MRRVITFSCEGDTLIGSLDEASATVGLLIVSGGNEIRAGAHRGMAMLAQAVAAAGFPVFRFDRRGVGDSSGENRSFRSSRPDIAAAAAAFRAEAGVSRVVGFGNCDAASALALFGRAAGIEALVLANPWVVEPAADLPPPAAVRARYAAKLRDPAEWRRLVTGGVSPGKLARGLARAAKPQAAEADALTAIGGWHGAATMVLAKGDATAIAYAAAAKGRTMPPAVTLDTASHSFADAGETLTATVLAHLWAIDSRHHGDTLAKGRGDETCGR
jgi:exosortase A-associated hydrolase 1